MRWLRGRGELEDGDGMLGVAGLPRGYQMYHLHHPTNRDLCTLMGREQG